MLSYCDCDKNKTKQQNKLPHCKIFYALFPVKKALPGPWQLCWLIIQSSPIKWSAIDLIVALGVKVPINRANHEATVLPWPPQVYWLTSLWLTVLHAHIFVVLMFLLVLELVPAFHPSFQSFDTVNCYQCLGVSLLFLSASWNCLLVPIEEIL